MNKSDLVKAIADHTGLSQRDVSDVLKSIEHVAMVSLIRGEKIILPGVGVLHVAQRAARSARNPKTGETVAVPARKTVRLRLSPALKGAIK